MKPFLALFLKDLSLARRNYFLAIVVIVALLLVGVVRFLVPEQVSTEQKVYFYAEAPSTARALSEVGFLSVGSRRSLDEALAEDQEAMGLYEEQGTVHLIGRGYETERTVRSLSLLVSGLLASGEGGREIEVETLRPASSVREAFNDRFVPLLILNEPIMLGFVFIATLLFFEKEERTLTAFKVTPGGKFAYVGSKLLLMILLTYLSTVIIVLGTIGIDVHWGYLILLVTLGSLFASSLALWISSHFDRLTEAMSWIIAVSLVLSLPIVSYFAPSFRPEFFLWMPTYRLMFALRDAVFFNGNHRVILETARFFLLLDLGLLVLSLGTFSRRFGKEVM